MLRVGDSNEPGFHGIDGHTLVGTQVLSKNHVLCDYRSGREEEGGEERGEEGREREEGERKGGMRGRRGERVPPCETRDSMLALCELMSWLVKQER